MTYKKRSRQGVNIVHLMGFITGKLILSDTGNNRVLRFRINTPRFVPNGDSGKTVDDINTVCVWGRKGERLYKLMAPGSHIYVQGKLRTSSYDDKKLQTTYVQADEVVFVGKKPKKKKP